MSAGAALSNLFAAFEKLGNHSEHQSICDRPDYIYKTVKTGYSQLTF